MFAAVWTLLPKYMKLSIYLDNILAYVQLGLLGATLFWACIRLLYEIKKCACKKKNLET